MNTQSKESRDQLIRQRKLQALERQLRELQERRYGKYPDPSYQQTEIALSERFMSIVPKKNQTAFQLV